MSIEAIITNITLPPPNNMHILGGIRKRGCGCMKCHTQQNYVTSFNMQ